MEGKVKEKKGFVLPSALIIVYIFLLIVAFMSWFVPVSVVTTDENGVNRIHYNAALDDEGNLIEDAGTDPAGIWQVALAPVEGFQSASDVGFTILISGAFLTILSYVGAMDAGIGQLLKRFKGNTLIVLLMLVFALMGTVYGSWEELPAYALVIIPLFVKAGYDVMTGISVIFVGASVGNMASIVNPYSTGAAVAAIDNPELSLGSGILLRMIIFAALFAGGTFLVLRYAKMVKEQKEKSVVAGMSGINTMTREEKEQLPELTPRRKWSLAVFGIMILMTVLGYIPWSAITCGNDTMYEVVNAPLAALAEVPVLGKLFGTGGMTWFGDWYFDEFCVVFLIGTIVVAFINRLSEKEFVQQFMTGCKDLLGVVMVLAVARGISLLMGTKTSGMSITFIYWIQNLLQGVPLWAFAIAAVAIYALIGIFLQSTSGVAGITMPILGAVAMALFIGMAADSVGGQVILIAAFTTGLNFINSLYPGATIIGVLEMANVPYDCYMRLMLKFMVPLLAISTLIILAAPYIGLVS